MVERFESAPAHEACASVNARHPHFFQRRMGREESLSFLPRTILRSARIKTYRPAAKSPELGRGACRTQTRALIRLAADTSGSPTPAPIPGYETATLDPVTVHHGGAWHNS